MKKSKLLLSLLLSASIFTGCDSDDDMELFDEPADVRLNNTLAGYQEQMTSEAENGWKVRYFPDSDRAGGWTFLMKFNDDNTVEMVGDVTADPEVEEGYYQMLRSQGPVLSFGSYLPITELVNPNSAYPESRYGSNDFIFVDQDFTGPIELVSNRNRSPFVLETATQEDWNDISEHEETEQNFVGGEVPPSVYRYFTVSDGSETVVSSMSYNSFLRFMNLRSQGTNAVQSSGHGVAFGKDSIFINSPIEFGGEEIERMVYLEETQEFYGESNGVEARLYYSGEPAFNDDDYLYPYDSNAKVLSGTSGYLNDSRDEYTTDTYRELFDQTDEILAQSGFYISRVQLYFNYAPEGAAGRYRVTFQVSNAEGNSYYVRFFMDLAHENNKMYLIPTGEITYSNSAVTSLTAEDFEPLLKFYTDPEGLYVDHIGSFLGYTNPGYTLVSASRPNIRILLYE